MRHARAGRKPPHGAGIQPETLQFGSLFAVAEQRLQAEADSQERHAAPDRRQQIVPDPDVIECPQHLPEVPHTRQDHLRSLANARGIAHDPISGPDLLERVGHRSQIARTVIDNRDHRSPFVDGNWSFSRLSFEQANFIARAKHLKIASSLWWFDRP